MSTCSCCTLIVWSWSINRLYIKDYKQNRSIHHPRLFPQKNPSTSVSRVSNTVRKYNTYFPENKTFSLSYIVDEKYSKTVYACIHIMVYILTSYLTRPCFGLTDPDFNIVKAGGLIIYKTKILIVQSNFNKWGFPKGNRNQGESVLDCAIREIKEETSLIIDLIESDRLLCSFNNTVMYYKKLDCKPKINIKHIIREQKDCTGIAWIRLSCLKKQIIEKNSIPFTSLLRKFVMHYF